MPMFFAVFGSKKMRLVSQFTELPPEAALTGLLSLSGGLFYLNSVVVKETVKRCARIRKFR